MFKDFKKLMQEHFELMLLANQTFYLTDVDKDLMWQTYLNSFPEDKRQEYNCNCCKQFVRNYGNIVALVGGNVCTIWNFYCPQPFFKVVSALDKLIQAAPIVDVFFTDQAKLGTDKNRQLVPGGGDGQPVITWEHMFFQLPKTRVHKGSVSIATLMGAARDGRNVFKRSLDEITIDSLETVLDLIAQNSLYRGADYTATVNSFLGLKKAYEAIPEKDRDNFCWLTAPQQGGSVAKIRGTAIGTLLLDISNGKDLDEAVRAFERIMAPTNYKRPNALITQKMIEQAEKTIGELGYANSLGRRFAVPDDITVNEVLFVDRNKKKSSGILGDLKDTVAVNPKTFSRLEEVPIADFMSKILPRSTGIEVLFENRHINNLVSLITAKDPKAPTLFKWDNPFSWSYKNSVADSLKEKVKAAGGRVDGELRVSLEWSNLDDLDLHVIEPSGGSHIYYSQKHSPSTGGNLDVDMNAGSGKTRTPVENIIWPNKQNMLEGKYQVRVVQFQSRETIDVGYSVEVECQGQLLTFSKDRSPSQRVSDVVVIFEYTKADGIKIISGMEATSKVASQTIWGLPTQQFHKASMILNSPNYWGDNKISNLHTIFALTGARNDEQTRGFFNEFLKEELTPHKRVFEALGSRLKVEPSDQQVTGLGFSVTQHTDLIVKIEGHVNRTLKIKF